VVSLGMERGHCAGRIEDPVNVVHDRVRRGLAVRQGGTGAHVRGTGEVQRMADLPLPWHVSGRRLPPRRRGAPGRRRGGGGGGGRGGGGIGRGRGGGGIGRGRVGGGIGFPIASGGTPQVQRRRVPVGH